MKKPLLALLALLALVTGCSTGTTDNDGSPGGGQRTEEEPSRDEVEYDAFETCKDFVRDRLRSPSTASFRNQNEDDGEVQIAISGDRVVVDSTVDSENGFGAEIRSTFHCELEDHGDTWRLADLTLDGEQVGGTSTTTPALPPTTAGGSRGLEPAEQAFVDAMRDRGLDSAAAFPQTDENVLAIGTGICDAGRSSGGVGLAEFYGGLLEEHLRTSVELLCPDLAPALAELDSAR